MKTINLTKGFKVIVDDDDFEFLSQYKWVAETRNGRAIPRTDINKKRIYLHRLLLGDGEYKAKYIDDNSLNCRRENLTKRGKK